MTTGYFITGTDTGVGKTLVSSALVHRFASQGLRSVGMKPVAAGCTMHDGQLQSDDVAMLIAASNVKVSADLVNPYAFASAIAPHIAAAQAGVDIELGVIERAHAQLVQQAEVVIVEGVGGFRVPLGPVLDTADLAAALQLPVILVVGMRLGCLSHALLTAEAITARGLRLAGWVANRIDPAMPVFEENLQALQQRLPAPYLGVVPWLSGADFREAAAYIALDS